MILQPPSQTMRGTPIPSTYTIQGDFLECLGLCDQIYTSDNINNTDGGRFDPRVPTILRASAMSPQRFYCTPLYTDRGTDNKGETMLQHASAVIPASNGAYWVVYPFHYDVLDTTEEKRKSHQNYSRLSVRYYPPNAKKDDSYIGLVTGNFYKETIVGTPNEFTLPNDEKSGMLLFGGHPCGATYLNITLPIIIQGKAYDAVKSSPTYKDVEGGNTITRREAIITELESFFGQEGVHIGDSEKPCIDVLVCYGGYHWVWRDGKLQWRPDGTIRFYTPTTRIIVPSQKGEDIVRDSNRIVWQTICCGNSKEGFFDWTVPPVRVGASLVKLEGNKFMSVGGVVFKRLASEGVAETLGMVLPARSTSCYPWTEYHVNAVVNLTEFTVGSKTANVLHTEVRISNFMDYTNITPRFFGESAYYPCFNPMSQETVEAIAKGKTDVLLHKNEAPLMYPTLFVVDGYIIAHGAEWIGDAKKKHAETLFDYVKANFPIPSTDKYEANVCHIPLITSQYVLRKPTGGELVAYPLNYSGALGMMEGAIAFPSADEKSLIVMGGVSSKYSEHSYAVRKGLRVEGKEYDLVPQLTEIIWQLAPDYTPGIDRLFSWESKIITPAKGVTHAAPYIFGKDSLISDCMFSQCVQLGTSDYFVAPSSYFQYYEGDDTEIPNMTLLRRRTPLELNDPALDGMNAFEAYHALTSRVFVSEIINLPIWRESAETYAAETPTFYGRASTAKCSLGAILDEQKKGYWIYKLGNGREPAVYYHITTQTKALNVWPLKQNGRADQIDTPTYLPKETQTPGYPDKEWA